jgi:DNA-binding GntR family transcriptional regulator
MMRMYLEQRIWGHALPKLTNQILGQATDILEHFDNNSDLSIQDHRELNWQFHTYLYRAAKRPTLFNTIANRHQLCSVTLAFILLSSTTSTPANRNIINC